jgi:hypothetical protein
MSAVHQVLESSVVKAILQDSTANTSAALSFGNVTEALAQTVTNYGLHISTAFASFVLNIYAGTSQETQELPCLNVWCVTANGYDATTPWVFRCDLNLSLRYPADDSTEVADVSAAMVGVSKWLNNLTSYVALFRDLIERSDNALAVSFVGPAQCNRGVDAGKRMQIIQWTMEVVCSLKP